MVESAFSSIGEPVDPEMDYRSVDRWCVAALVLGMLSSLALLDKPWWLVPVVGVATSGIALARLRANPERVGRGAALAGLGLSIIFAVAAVAQVGVNYVVLPPQARPVADQWLEFLRDDAPEKAYMLTVPADYRRFDETRWYALRRDE